MEGKAIFALLGVVCICAAPCSGNDVSEPIVENVKTGIATPEVVLQLKYERGALDRIYLTRFRQDAPPRSAGPPRPDRPPPSVSVPAANRLCADLCYAGLGGDDCGGSCADMMPVGLATALRSENQSIVQYGEPRIGVCPALCANRLGIPLCNCAADRVRQQPAVNWGAVCDAFCFSDGYVLGGCPPCKNTSVPSAPAAVASARLLHTAEGWASWCSAQCRQGHGGAACNCDRAPFQ